LCEKAFCGIFFAEIDKRIDKAQGLNIPNKKENFQRNGPKQATTAPDQTTEKAIMATPKQNGENGFSPIFAEAEKMFERFANTQGNRA
jgi:hypothetical protein